ncbi:lipopolysaccharide biosynthesis protein RfbH [Olsenella sp. An270]|uniref:lipopolysaccharide biosynthesis protein RfbH n=1 Tax=Olsenella sp. An270 TaxID=1965615 RepID=UPI000B38A462|nr:lipopolysaccharide biosynthesis protein RfbH [Olsenella sp. An270]OUO58201.1 lipopolysaccharide biosynthesis protein RfbH [Olsenella sp. An270]
MAFEGKTEQEAREEILALVAEYTKAYKMPKPWQPGERISYAGRVFDEREIVDLVDSSLDFWLTAGRYTEKFESEFAKYVGVKYAAVTNSGSSANLLAFSALTAQELGDRAIRPGDEVITVAAGFPTTVSPIIQFGAVPVFVDVTIPQYNIDVTKLEEAVSPKTKAVIIAHTLGNPFDLAAVKSFCDKHNLWLVEDSCDALGSRALVDGELRMCGTVGDIGTASFYPAHHMTMGEGGAVFTNNPLLSRLVRSFRDWGRDCVCRGGEDNRCGHRFDGQYGELPRGYDHKYVYSHFGYNLKVTDMQAAIGCAQLEKIADFVEARKKNWAYLRDALAGTEDKLILPEPLADSDPSWFGFVITSMEGVDGGEVARHVEAEGVQTRRLFAGNLLRHPCFDPIRNTDRYRVVGSLDQTDRIMHDTFWIGVYPGMTDEKLEYMANSVRRAIS